jgi:hypothetical protein
MFDDLDADGFALAIVAGCVIAIVGAVLIALLWVM